MVGFVNDCLGGGDAVRHEMDETWDGLTTQEVVDRVVEESIRTDERWHEESEKEYTDSLKEELDDMWNGLTTDEKWKFHSEIKSLLWNSESVQRRNRSIDEISAQSRANFEKRHPEIMAMARPPRITKEITGEELEKTPIRTTFKKDVLQAKNIEEVNRMRQVVRNFIKQNKEN